MRKRIICLSTSFAICISFASCSLMEKIGTKTSSDGSSENTTEVRIPTDRESVAPHKNISTYSPEELKNGAVKGDWAIQSVFGKEAVGETAPFIKFEPTENKIYGNNGCNTINGDYLCNPADSTLSFSNVISTMRACALEGITDYEINHALSQVKYYRWSNNDSEYYIYLLDAMHKPLITLMHQNFQFLNGTWLVQTIHETEINVSPNFNVPDMKLVIDVDEGKVHGNTGCNILNGTLETDMDAPNSISFQQMITTRMSCPDSNNYEQDLLVALEEVTSARPISKNRVDLLDGSNTVVLSLIRTSDK